ncbi:MAG: DUF3570 domain-containing protein [Candidatus Manganitrophus sp.]|nr:DUF3570 domain-containing protein [Candidatus Manganitrophus sp.]
MRLQLNGKKSIRNALAVAACTLLSQTPAPAATDEFPWKADLSTLYYTEKDRVTVSESILSLRRDIGSDEAFALKVTYDAISGASANGAIFGTDSGGVQTVTSPSGVARTISVGAGARVDPLTEFEDNRIAAQLALEKALWRTLTARVEGNLSTEHDYDSYGAGGLILVGSQSAADDADRRRVIQQRHRQAEHRNTGGVQQRLKRGAVGERREEGDRPPLRRLAGGESKDGHADELYTGDDRRLFDRPVQDRHGGRFRRRPGRLPLRKTAHRPKPEQSFLARGAPSDRRMWSISPTATPGTTGESAPTPPI